MVDLQTKPLPKHSPRHTRQTSWKPSRTSIAVGVLAILGMTFLVYPTASSWFAQYNQSAIIRAQQQDYPLEDEEHQQLLANAREYNDALTSGVFLGVNSHLPEGTGESINPDLRYRDQLLTQSSQVMARVVVPKIDVDLPIYHGTDEATLLRGGGHLEGTHLPVGGESTHSAITAHRGLAKAKFFSDLDKIDIGDTFNVVTLGETLTYQVVDTKEVLPEETDTLKTVEGRDLVTLITCTPLGINSHRILVTGERITPTPPEQLRFTGEPYLPHFPWWALAYGTGVIGAVWYVIHRGIRDPQRPPRPKK